MFREAEEILTLGALIAARMFERPLAVLRLSDESHAALAREERAEITGGRLRAGALDLPLVPVTAGDLALDAGDRARLGGAGGRAVQLAQEVLGTMAAVQGATRLIDVTRGHIDGCILAHDANLIFAEAMAEMGAKGRDPDHDQRDFGGPAGLARPGRAAGVRGQGEPSGRCLCADGGRADLHLRALSGCVGAPRVAR